MESEMNVRGCD